MNPLLVLFPRVRAEMLRLLFTQPGCRVHLRELERQSGLSLKTVQTELASLEVAGLVHSRRDGNRKYFSANQAHPVCEDLSRLVLKTSGLHDLVLGALQPLKGIEVALIFGSMASGKATQESDIDLLVIGNIGLRSLASSLRKVSEQTSREVNPITMTRQEFLKGKLQHPLLIDIQQKPIIPLIGNLHELG